MELLSSSSVIIASLWPPSREVEELINQRRRPSPEVRHNLDDMTPSITLPKATGNHRSPTLITPESAGFLPHPLRFYTYPSAKCTQGYCLAEFRPDQPAGRLTVWFAAVMPVHRSLATARMALSGHQAHSLVDELAEEPFATRSGEHVPPGCGQRQVIAGALPPQPVPGASRPKRVSLRGCRLAATKPDNIRGIRNHEG